MTRTDIFVVDDGRVIGQTLGIILRNTGYRVGVFEGTTSHRERGAEPSPAPLRGTSLPWAELLKEAMRTGRLPAMITG